MIKQLISIRLRSLMSSMGGKKKDGTVAKLSVGKIILFAVLYLYLAAVFVGLFTFLAIGMGITMIPTGQDAMYYGMFVLIGFSMVFIFSIFETKAELFDCKDNELLLSMPIKPSHIVVSRVSTVLIYNYVEMALVMLPAIIVYAVMGGSPIGVAGGILVYLLLPLFATALSSGVGYIVAAVSRRIKNKTLVTTLISLMFLLAYFYFYFGFIGEMGSETEDTIAINIPNVPIIAALGAPALLKPIPTLIFAAASLGSAYFAFRTISAQYFKITADRGVTNRVEYKAEKLVKRTALSALTCKELRRFFSSSVYMLNAGMGVIFTVVLGVAALLYSSDVTEFISALGLPQGTVSVIFVIGMTFCSGMTMISASALSLEGKSLWIPKSMPIATRTVLLSKLLPHIIITTPTTLICSALLMIAGDAAPAEIPFYVLTPLLANVMLALFGLVLNVAFPKFEYVNEAQPVKSSAPVFFTMLFGMAWSLVVSGVGIALSLFGLALIAHLLIFLMTAAVCAILTAVLLGPCVRKYDRLGV